MSRRILAVLVAMMLFLSLACALSPSKLIQRGQKEGAAAEDTTASEAQPKRADSPTAELTATPKGAEGKRGGGGLEGKGGVSLKDIPVYKGARRDEEASAKLTQGLSQLGQPAEVALLSTSSTPSKVVEFYRKKMADLGWKKKMAFTSDEGGFLAWEKGGQGVQVAVAAEKGKTTIMIGVGPADANLLPSQASLRDTNTPTPISTATPAPTPTPKPAVISAKDGYSVALAKAQKWQSKVVLLDVLSQGSLFEKSSVDQEGKSSRWRYTFAMADPKSEEDQNGRFEVWVTAEGIDKFGPTVGMIRVSDYRTIASIDDWQIDSPAALEVAEQEGGKAFRESQGEEAPLSANLYLAPVGLSYSVNGIEWHIMYFGGKTFIIDGTTGKVLAMR